MKTPKEKKERALGMRLGVKGARCESPKCAAVRKPYKPGMHGPKKGRRKTQSDFGKQLNEKQKVKVSYGIDERALRRLFKVASESKEGTSIKLIELLERRLDSVVHRLRLAPSRSASRQLVVHGHIEVNGKTTYSPGLQVSEGDVISVKSSSRDINRFASVKGRKGSIDIPEWLSLDNENLSGKVIGTPANANIPFEINLLVEAFSK